MHICCTYVRDFLKGFSSKNPKYKIYYNAIPLGISYISSCLKLAGHTTEMLYVSPYTHNTFDTYIEKQPQIFAISVMSESDYDLALKVIFRLKTKYKNSKIIIGGVAVTLAPQKFIDIYGVDAICLGAGEKAVVEYVKQVETKQLKKTDNLWIKTEKEILKCDKVLTVENLDELPYPDRKAWTKYIKEEEIYVCSVPVNRGCIYNCVFCANKQLREAITNREKYFNKRKPEEIIKEIDYCIKEKNDIQGVYLTGENIADNIDYFITLLSLLIKYNELREKKLWFLMNITFIPDLLDENIINLMKKANFRIVLLSLESGSQNIRKIIGKPNYTNEEFITFCKKLKKLNIDLFIYTMYCFPLETNKTWLKTVKVLKQCKPYDFSHSWLDCESIPITRDVHFGDIFRFIIFRPLVFFLLKKFLAVLDYFLYSYRKVFDLVLLKKIRTRFAKQEFDRGNYKQAIKIFNKIKINQDNQWIYADRAIAKMNINDYKGAIKDFDKIIKSDSNDFYIQKRKECLDKLNNGNI